MNFIERMKFIPHIAPVAGLRLKTNLNNMSTSHIKFRKDLNIKKGAFIISQRMQGKDNLYNIATGKIVTTKIIVIFISHKMFDAYSKIYQYCKCINKMCFVYR